MQNSQDETDIPLDDLLDEIEEALNEGDASGARDLLEAAREVAPPDHPEVAYAEACIFWLEENLPEAQAGFNRVLELDSTYADAHYALGRLCEEQGLPQEAIDHNLHVLRIDARNAREAKLASQDDLSFIESVASRVLAELPTTFAERLAHVPVLLESRPSIDLVKSGFDPRALGLFEGPESGETNIVAPTRIVLYTHNLLADFPAPNELEAEIEVTLLHEIGHYFGLDEADMERLGLD